MSLFEFNKERFFSDHEKIILDKICLNVHDYLNNPDIKNTQQWSQEGKYTNASEPFYWYSESKEFAYSSKDKKRSITFYKYFYKNKKDYENIKGLVSAFFDEYSGVSSDHIWNAFENNFPVTNIIIHCPYRNIDASFVKMQYDNHMVSKNCENTLIEETLKMLNKCFEDYKK